MRNSFQKLYYYATLSQMPVDTQTITKIYTMHNVDLNKYLSDFFCQDSSAKLWEG